MSTEEAKKIAREVYNVGGRIIQGQEGGALGGIILAIAGTGMLTILGIGAYGLATLIDMKSEVAEVKAKVEILYQERKRP